MTRGWLGAAGPSRRSVGLTLVALALVAFLTQCKSLSGIDPMTEEGWEHVQIPLGGQRTSEIFLSYREAEREGPIASVSVRLEVLSGGAEFIFRTGGSRMQVRSDLLRMQFDCIKHARRILRVTHYQNNNLQGASSTEFAGTHAPWLPYGPGSTRIDAAPDDPAMDNPVWDIVATTVCARTAL